MNNATNISWIFLAIAFASQKSPADYREISGIADGINHAVPTQKELQHAIKWLIQREFIIKTDKRYSLTNLGDDMISKAKLDTHIIFEIWKNLEIEIKNSIDKGI